MLPHCPHLTMQQAQQNKKSIQKSKHTKCHGTLITHKSYPFPLPQTISNWTAVRKNIIITKNKINSVMQSWAQTRQRMGVTKKRENQDGWNSNCKNNVTKRFWTDRKINTLNYASTVFISYHSSTYNTTLTSRLYNYTFLQKKSAYVESHQN